MSGIVGMGSANERRRYNVALSLIGWAHTQNDSCLHTWYRLLTGWYYFKVPRVIIKSKQHFNSVMTFGEQYCDNRMTDESTACSYSLYTVESSCGLRVVCVSQITFVWLFTNDMKSICPWIDPSYCNDHLTFHVTCNSTVCSTAYSC